jgi:hypothetical protein
MIVEDKPPVAQRNSDHPMVGIVLLVGLSVLILVGSIIVSGLRFANAADFFVPFWRRIVRVYIDRRLPTGKNAWE